VNVTGAVGDTAVSGAAAQNGEPERSLSASDRWRRHYVGPPGIGCPVCQIDERDPWRDRLCAIGSELRAAAIADSRKDHVA